MPTAVHHSVGLEDTTISCLARLTAPDGTGVWTTVPGEGKWLKQADFTSITGRVYDVTIGNTQVGSDITLTVANVIQDTPVTTKELWTADDVGWNFRYDVLGSTYFLNSGRQYAIEFSAVLSAASEPFTFKYLHSTERVIGS